MHTFRTPH